MGSEQTSSSISKLHTWRSQGSATCLVSKGPIAAAAECHRDPTKTVPVHLDGAKKTSSDQVG